jgi:anti-sigma factor RsiW
VGKVHLGLDDLSAFADGELEPGEAREARAHLGVCARCSAELAAFTRLDNVLLSTAPVNCAGSLELRSALLDGQLTAAEAAIAREHIQACQKCATDEVDWLAAGQALRLLPGALPSARVDAAIRKLTERPSRRSLLPGFSGLASSLGLRVGVAATLVLTIVIGLVPTGPAPELAQAPNEALVSSVQQVVLYSPTNTFYVLQHQQAAVDAVDATTYARRTRIDVGGKPTAIALDAVAGRILVLDSSRKSLIEIDPASDMVVRSTPVEVTGTPTSLRVASDGRVVVTAIPDPARAGPRAPRPTPKSAAGEVAVLDTERKLEVVRSVEVAPRQVITDPHGKGALFLSPSATTLVDSSYQAQRTLPGGVGAAYGSAGWIAVLGASGAADAVLHLIGEGAPAPIRLTGAPLAVTAMPDGGFAVLLGSSGGAGRIVVIDEAGAPVGTTPVDRVGSDLTYDPNARRFAIVSGGNVVSAALPAGIVARQPAQTVPPSPSIAPSIPTTVPLASDPGSPAPSASVDPLASPSPAPSAPVALASPSAPPAVPPSAERISDPLYRISLKGQLPILTASSASRVWFLDQANGLNALDIWSGSLYRIASLPAEARIREMAATESYLFALDSLAGTIYVLSVETERVRAETLAPFRGATALTTDGGSQVWIASGRTPEIFSLDARSKRLEVVDVGIQAEILAFDAPRGIWLSDGGKRLVFYDFRSGLATELGGLRSSGSARSLLPDPSGTLWVGTTAGEVLSVRARTQETVVLADRPITSLALDSGGSVWYVAPSRAAADRFVYAPASAGSSERMLPGPATSFTFNPAWRAWLADPFGGFYLAIESPR